MPPSQRIEDWMLSSELSPYEDAEPFNAISDLKAALAHARLMAESPGRDPANVLRDVRGALGLNRNTSDPAGGDE